MNTLPGPPANSDGNVYLRFNGWMLGGVVSGVFEDLSWSSSPSSLLIWLFYLFVLVDFASLGDLSPSIYSSKAGVWSDSLLVSKSYM